jgi:magnesium transporter
LIRTLLYDPDRNEVRSGGQELIPAWRQNADTTLWLDCVDEPIESERQLLREGFDLHPLAIQDAERSRHPPKVESFSNFTFILLKGLNANSEALDFSTIQLAIFIGERFMVTRRSGESRSTSSLFQEAKDDPGVFAQGPAALAMRLCRKSVDRYIRILLDLEPRLEAMESEVMQHPDDALLAELLNYKTQLKKYRRVFLYHEQVFDELRSGSFAFIEPERKHEIVDVYEQQERAGSLAALYYELATDLADGYISVTSHRLNQIMKVLTVVMSIFVPLSFLAGIYGMNFENMPELRTQSGYFILLGLMGTLVTALLILFRRKRWL